MRTFHLALICLSLAQQACDPHADPSPSGAVAVPPSLGLIDELTEVAGLRTEEYEAIRGTASERPDTVLLARLLRLQILKRMKMPSSSLVQKRVNAEYSRLRSEVDDWSRHLTRVGETDGSLRKALEEKIRIDLLARQRASEKIDGTAVLAEYEELKKSYSSTEVRIAASEIGILADNPDRIADDPWQAARALADKTLREVRAHPESFPSKARIISEVRSSAQDGQMGIFSLEAAPIQVPESLFALEEGEVSEVIKGKFGYHIFRVDRRFEPGPLPFDAMEARLREKLIDRQMHEERIILKKRLTTESLQLLASKKHWTHRDAVAKLKNVLMEQQR